jgi:membrane associated rhomboid family serine protease
MLFWQLLPTSHRILLSLGVVYFVNIAMRGMLTQWLALLPFSAVGAGQYWRFFTYPLATSSFWEMLSTSLIFYFFAPEVERILTPRRLMLTLAMVIVVHGFSYAPLLWVSSVPLSGSTAMSLFILTMYIYLYPTGEVSLFGIVPLRATMLLGIMFVIAIASSLISSSFNPAALLHTFANEGFGIFFGFVFSHLYFGTFSSFNGFSLFKKKSPPAAQSGTTLRRATAATSAAPSGGGRTPASAAEAERRTVAQQRTDDDDDLSLDEERLNQILDKITEKGQAALTSAEQKFLKDYASRL